MTEVELRNLKVALNTRLDGALSDIKENYDDSRTGFIEAWDVVNKFFEDIIAKLPR